MRVRSGGLPFEDQHRERQHVLGALEKDDVLTKRQKQKVRAQVDRWFERDADVSR